MICEKIYFHHVNLSALQNEAKDRDAKSIAHDAIRISRGKPARNGGLSKASDRFVKSQLHVGGCHNELEHAMKRLVRSSRSKDVTKDPTYSRLLQALSESNNEITGSQHMENHTAGLFELVDTV